MKSLKDLKRDAKDLVKKLNDKGPYLSDDWLPEDPDLRSQGHYFYQKDMIDFSKWLRIWKVKNKLSKT